MKNLTKHFLTGFRKAASDEGVNPYMLPAIGGLGGAAAGYLSGEDEDPATGKKGTRLRNSLLGGAGGVGATYGLDKLMQQLSQSQASPAASAPGAANTAPTPSNPVVGLPLQGTPEEPPEAYGLPLQGSPEMPPDAVGLPLQGGSPDSEAFPGPLDYNHTFPTEPWDEAAQAAPDPWLTNAGGSLPADPSSLDFNQSASPDPSLFGSGIGPSAPPSSVAFGQRPSDASAPLFNSTFNLPPHMSLDGGGPGGTGLFDTPPVPPQGNSVSLGGRGSDSSLPFGGSFNLPPPMSVSPAGTSSGDKSMFGSPGLMKDKGLASLGHRPSAPSSPRYSKLPPAPMWQGGPSVPTPNTADYFRRR